MLALKLLLILYIWGGGKLGYGCVSRQDHRHGLALEHIHIWKSRCLTTAMNDGMSSHLSSLMHQKAHGSIVQAIHFFRAELYFHVRFLLGIHNIHCSWRLCVQ